MTDLSKINFSKIYGKGSYVLITGSSDGIGKTFAEFFASKGFNLILWSRTLSKLQSLKKKLEEKYSEIDIKLIAGDFAECVEENYFNENLKSVEDLDVSILVNNVGIFRSCHNFENSKVSDLVQSVNINMVPQAVLTSIYLRKFSQRKNLKSGIIDLSSTAGLSPLPFIKMYSSSKKFNTYFTNSIKNGYGNDNLNILSVQPSPVETKMGRDANQFYKQKKDMKKVYAIVKSTSEDCIEGSIKCLGQTGNSGGSLKHSIFTLFMNLPENFNLLRDSIFGAFRNLRKYSTM